MRKLLLFLAAFALAGAAAAQQFKWVDKDGKVRYGDTPPPGVKATPLGAPATGRAPAPAPAPDAAAKDAKDAKKGPLTPAEQEAEFRRRQQQAAKDADKEAKLQEDARARKENCANSQAQLRQLESGQRVSRIDDKGERVFVDDEQRKVDTARARKLVSEWCGG
jgi:hypothetical protein